MVTYMQLSTKTKMPLVGLDTWKVTASEKSTSIAELLGTKLISPWSSSGELSWCLGALLYLAVGLNLHGSGATEK